MEFPVVTVCTYSRVNATKIRQLNVSNNLLSYMLSTFKVHNAVNCSHTGLGLGVGTKILRIRYIRNPVYPNTRLCTKHTVSCFCGTEILGPVCANYGIITESGIRAIDCTSCQNGFYTKLAFFPHRACTCSTTATIFASNRSCWNNSTSCF